MGVLEEEPEHLPRGIGPLRIGVGPGGAAARPGMSGPVDDPVLEDRLSARVGVEPAAISMPTGYPTLLHRLPEVRHRSCSGLRHDPIAVARVHRGIPIPMEHDRRNNPSRYLSTPRVAGSARGDGLTVLHCGECRGKIARGSPGEAGMHADRGVEIGVGHPHNGGSRPPAESPAT